MSTAVRRLQSPAECVILKPVIFMLLISIMDIDKKQQHSHAHALLRECLKRRDIAYTEDTPTVRGDLGKPSLAEHPEVHYNLSHANGIAACIVSDRECGIDCEQVREYRPNVLKRAFSERERQLIEDTPPEQRDLMFFRLWTLKEAYVKAIGIGISYPLTEAEFSFDGNRIVTDIGGYSFRQYLIRDGRFVVSVCEQKDQQLNRR